MRAGWRARWSRSRSRSCRSPLRLSGRRCCGDSAVSGRRGVGGRRRGVGRGRRSVGRRWTVCCGRRCRRRAVAGRWRGGARREIRSYRGAKRIHAFGRAKARGCRRERARIYRGRAPGGGGRLGRGRAVVRRRHRSCLPGLCGWWRLIRLRRWRRLRRRTPRGSGRARLRRGGGRGSAVCGRRSRRGQRVAARQAKLAGGLVRRATPRAHDHVKTPELELCPAHLRG